MIPLVLSRLIESNYQIYIPLFKSNDILIQRLGNEILRCATMNASQDNDKTPLIRTPENKVDLVACADQVSRTVWLIPFGALENRKVIRLGSRYEEYVVPEPTSKTFQEQKLARINVLRELKERARAIAQRSENGLTKGNKDEIIA